MAYNVDPFLAVCKCTQGSAFGPNMVISFKMLVCSCRTRMCEAPESIIMVALTLLMSWAVCLDSLSSERIINARDSVLIRLGSGLIASVFSLAGLLLPLTNSVVSSLVDFFSSFSKLTNCFVFSLGDFVSWLVVRTPFDFWVATLDGSWGAFLFQSPIKVRTEGGVSSLYRFIS